MRAMYREYCFNAARGLINLPRVSFIIYSYHIFIMELFDGSESESK